MPHRAKLPMDLAAPTSPAKALTTAHETMARPKVMRRPAQFSQDASAGMPLLSKERLLATPTADSPGAPLPSVTLAPLWQDDGRFAVALLAIIITVNVVVSVWLSMIATTPGTPASLPTTQSTPSTSTIDTPEDTLIHELSAAGAASSEQ